MMCIALVADTVVPVDTEGFIARVDSEQCHGAYGDELSLRLQCGRNNRSMTGI